MVGVGEHGLGSHHLRHLRVGGVCDWHVVALDRGLHLGGNRHVNHHWLEVVRLGGSILGRVLSYPGHFFMDSISGLGSVDNGSVLHSKLLLVGLDLGPAFPLSRGMLVLHVGLEDLFIVAIRADWDPDGVETPAATSLDHHAHGKAVDDSEDLALVPNDSHDEESDTVVVDVDRLLAFESFRVPDSEDDDGCEVDCIADQLVTSLETLHIEVNDEEDGDGRGDKDGPENGTPGLHRSPSQREVLQWADIGVGELETKEDEGGDPEVEVPLVNLVRGVFMAVSPARKMEIVHVVTLLQSVEEQEGSVVFSCL